MEIEIVVKMLKISRDSIKIVFRVSNEVEVMKIHGKFHFEEETKKIYY